MQYLTLQTKRRISFSRENDFEGTLVPVALNYLATWATGERTRVYVVFACQIKEHQQDTRSSSAKRPNRTLGPSSDVLLPSTVLAKICSNAAIELFVRNCAQIWTEPSTGAAEDRDLGRSHDGSFVLFRLGTRASSGVKLFAETGSADLLEQRGQGDGGVMDEFLAPAVSAGGGRTEATFFVDGNHSRGKITSSRSGWYSNLDFPATAKPDEIDGPSHVSTDVGI
uniref:Spondin domain-containing protein n=1 Tax=Timema bartmani TaxID=61472 RepID=A0A7R9HXV8_9NEOP|nr:unnamed protein product [Timema bartmani]